MYFFFEGFGACGGLLQQYSVDVVQKIEILLQCWPCSLANTVQKHWCNPCTISKVLYKYNHPYTFC